SNQIGTISGLTVTGGLTVVDGGPLVLAGVVGAGTADLTAQSVSQGAAGTLIAGVLTSTGGISGDAVLQGTANQIGTLGGFNATSTLVVVDGTAMTIAGANGASGGNVFLTTGTNALTFANGGTIASKAGGTIGIQADALVNLAAAAAT